MSGVTARNAQCGTLQNHQPLLGEEKAKERENAASLAQWPAPQAPGVPKPAGVCGVSTPSEKKKEKGSKRKAVKHGDKGYAV